MVHDRISDNTQAPERSAEENIKIISQIIDGYKQEIMELKKIPNPMNPLVVWEQREKQSTLQILKMVK